jgi:hypothetical protein
MRQSDASISSSTGRLVLTLIALLLAGCDHGPPESLATIADYDTPPANQVTIALRSFEVSRPARGLSAFPDGGIAIAVDQGVEVNVCERGTGKFRQIAVIHEPSRSSPSFSTPLILEWLDTAVRISRYTGGDTVVRLPGGLHTGVAFKDRSQRKSLPQCEQSLNALRGSNRMPDGTTITPLAPETR